MLDRVTTGPKPALVEALGATYHTGTVADIGLQPGHRRRVHRASFPLIQQAADAVAPGGIVCLTGVGPPSASTSGSASTLATDAVLKNLVLFGSVNANRRHYYRAAKVLAKADRSWLEQLVTRRVRPDDVDAGPDQDAGRHQGRHGVRARHDRDATAESPLPGARHRAAGC